MDLNTITAIVTPRDPGEISPWLNGDALLAGGTWLFSEPQPHLRRLIDLSSLGWVPATRSDDGLSLAATCTIAQLDRLELPQAWIAAPLIGQCCRALLGSFKVWNMATVGGNICMSLPAGPMISLATALEATCILLRPDGAERSLPVTDFVLGPLSNKLLPGEILRRIDISAAALRRRTAFRRISLRPVGRSGAVIIGTLGGDGSFVLSLTASVPRPVPLRFPALPRPDELHAAIDAAVPAGGWYDDVHGAPDWRRHVSHVFAEAILTELSA